MIEEKTTYAYKLKYQEDLSFDKIMSFTRNLINDLPQQLVDDMYEMLDRGVVQIDTEPQMLVYLYSFGKMHKAKLDCAFAHLPEDFLQQPEINIIDYGCGQAIGTMCYVDFLKEEGIIQNIKKVTLIEPSETCLKRAALHTSAFLPEAEINTVNKTFDKLLMTDIETDKNIPTLHILSNVLDLKFNLDRFAVVINEHIKGYNQFVCVGPYFSYSDKDERITKFCSLINGKENFSKVYDKYELDADKPWTAHIKLFSIGELEENLSTEATEQDIKNGIEDEFGVVYSKDGKRLLKCKEQKSGTYVIKKGTKVICNNAFDFSKDKHCKEIGYEDGYDANTNEYYSVVSYVHEIFKDGFDYIIIPDSVTSIGDKAFWDCIHLKQIKIPDSITNIGYMAFSGCSSLKQIKIPDSLTSIEVRTFEYCSSLLQIYIPNSITCIKDQAFYDCSSLQLIIIPDSVTIIGDYAFSGCSSLKQIDIPDSVACIGDRAFSGCSSLKQINIPDSVTSIGECAFSSCSSLKQINIPDSVTSIGDSAFYDCHSLQQINIPDSVTSIGNSVFNWCSSLKQIYIPDSVTSIGNEAFSGCENLTIKSNSTRFVVDKGLLIDVQRKTIISCVGTNKIIRIPDSVTSIGEWAFSGCSSLKQINIPDSVTCIGNGAFYGCSSLQQINIPDSVTSIGDSAFSDCHSLQQINIPDSVTSIGEWAFSSCSSLQQINIPDSVTSIGYGAFSDCPSLQQINIPANSIEKFKKMLPMDVWLRDILKEEDDERNLPF